jgi:PST family polysaccharide transporter
LFEMPGLVDMLRAMSMLFVIQAPGLVAEGLLQREMQMRALAMAESAGVLFGYLPLGIGLALLGYGIWSLVSAYLAQALIKCVALVWQRPHERAVLPEPGPARDLLWFSGGFVAARLCNVAASEVDKAVVGYWMSPAHLGVYGRAYRLMAMPAMFLGEVVDRIVFPLLSRLQDDREGLCQAYGRGVSLCATIMLPASAASIVLAPEFVYVMLGSGWDDAVAPFQVLMAGLLFRSGYKISDMLARATGTVYARAWRQAIFAAMILAGALVGTRWGITGVAAGIVAALAGNYFLMAWLSIETTGLGWGRFLWLHVRGVAFALAVGTGVAIVAAVVRQFVTWPPLVFLLTFVIATSALALAVVRAPARVLGSDGLWLVSTLRGRAGTS